LGLGSLRGKRGMAKSQIPEEVERVAREIVHTAYTVHRTLGPGMLESVYEVCLCHELEDLGRQALRQVPVPVQYRGIHFDEGFRLDILVDDLVVCELKAVDELHPRAVAQLLTYLRLSGKRLGFLLNFGAPIMKQGIKRLVV
jgi:GxxExxY protein